MKRTLVVATALTLVAACAGAFVLYRETGLSTPGYDTARVIRGDLEVVVLATGTVAPVNLVTVGAEVSGRLVSITADFNTAVEAGDVIAQIDPGMFEGRLAQARAEVAIAESNLAQRQAELSRAQAELAQARRVLDRREKLTREGHASTSELDAERTAFAAVAAQERIAEAAILNARAVLDQRRAAAQVAELDLLRTTIHSPVAGIVIRRSVEVGQTVAATLQAPELFQIAEDLRRMQVEASVDEADIGRVTVRQPARFMVDTFPDRVFEGEVTQVRKAPETAAGVVTYKVIIRVDNPDLALLPGMTASVAIVTGRRDGVLMVPNAALRFLPAGQAAATPSDGGHRVWVPGIPGPRARPVATGLVSEQHTEIVDGLDEGDAVIMRQAQSGS